MNLLIENICLKFDLDPIYIKKSKDLNSYSGHFVYGIFGSNNSCIGIGKGNKARVKNAFCYSHGKHNKRLLTSLFNNVVEQPINVLFMANETTQSTTKLETHIQKYIKEKYDAKGFYLWEGKSYSTESYVELLLSKYKNYQSVLFPEFCQNFATRADCLEASTWKNFKKYLPSELSNDITTLLGY